MVEELAGQLAGLHRVAVHALGDAVQGVGVVLVDGEFGLQAQAGQRRADLVGGVGQKGLHGVEVGLEPGHELVDRLDELRDLLRWRHGDGGKVVRLPLADHPLQRAQRGQRLPHAEPDQPARRDDGEGDGQEGVRQDVAGQSPALLPRLGDGDGDPAAKLRLRGEALQDGDAHRHAAEGGVLEPGGGIAARRAGDPGLGGGHRQVVVAGDQLAVRGGDPVEHAVAPRLGQDAQRGVGQVDGEAPVLHPHRVGDR